MTLFQAKGWQAQDQGRADASVQGQSQGGTPPISQLSAVRQAEIPFYSEEGQSFCPLQAFK